MEKGSKETFGREIPREEAPAGLYVHVPFCSGKCAYCDFYSVTASPHRVANWLRALKREAALYEDRFPRFDTLYLGGGTPSVLPVGELDRLLETLFRTFRFSRLTEITLEANPDDVTPETLKSWQTLEFNRISLGVQTLQERRLALLGRRHTAGQALIISDRRLLDFIYHVAEF